MTASNSLHRPTEVPRFHIIVTSAPPASGAFPMGQVSWAKPRSTTDILLEARARSIIGAMWRAKWLARSLWRAQTFAEELVPQFACRNRNHRRFRTFNPRSLSKEIRPMGTIESPVAQPRSLSKTTDATANDSVCCSKRATTMSIQCERPEAAQFVWKETAAHCG